MSSFEYRLTTRATPEQTLAYLGDPHNLERFIAEVTTVEPGAGDAYRVGFDRGFFIPDLVVDYVVERPGASVVMTGTSSQIDVVDRWDVTRAVDAGADVHYLGTYELKGVAKLTGPLAQRLAEWRAGGIQKDLRRELDAVAI